MGLVLAYKMIMLYTLYQFSRKYLPGFQSYCADILKFTKGHNSVRTVGEVNLYCLIMLYMCISFKKISQRVLEKQN